MAVLGSTILLHVGLIGPTMNRRLCVNECPPPFFQGIGMGAMLAQFARYRTVQLGKGAILGKFCQQKTAALR
jgi:hypothetical protein